MDYRYLEEDWDRERLRECVRLCVSLLQHRAYDSVIEEITAPTPADLEADGALDAWLRRNISTSYHISGTCKMGPASDPMAVVDQQLRVRGISNLRVADASVMPDVVRANTNVTTMMIAERVADFIRAGK
jgi:choline dehydrogenase